jgi:hypothetical protein
MEENKKPSTLIEIHPSFLLFDDGTKLYSDHERGCCEHHWLSFDDLTLFDFEGLEFDFSGDTFFKRIDGYGIELIPLHGHSVKIPGYGSNNGYYSSNLTLVIEKDGQIKEFDITECQEWSEY